MSPTMPQNAAGWRMEPPVSEPSAATAVPFATAAAEPPLEPPGTRDLSCGFFTTPYAEFSFEEPIANSSQFVFPRMIAPAASWRATRVDSTVRRAGSIVSIISSSLDDLRDFEECGVSIDDARFGRVAQRFFTRQRGASRVLAERGDFGGDEGHGWNVFRLHLV